MDATTVTFRAHHLVRLNGLSLDALNGKLARVESNTPGATGKFVVLLLDNSSRPPVPAVPAQRLIIAPKHFRHACEYCFVVAPEGEKLQMCSRCKTARYCNVECQRADWARHKDPDCLDTPLQQACMDGNVAELRRLVEVEGIDVNKASTNGPTPLTTATAAGHMSVVRYLVERGADVDKARATSITPLCVAAASGFLSILRFLVEQGADVDKMSDGGALFEAGATPLHHAAKEGHLAVVRYLVEQSADKDKIDCDSATPLYIAAQHGHVAVVRYLVEHGADKDKAKADGWTSLQVAIARGHMTVVAYLRALAAPTRRGS